MIMSKLFKILFGRELDDQRFLSFYDTLKLINGRHIGAYVSQNGNLHEEAKPHATVVAPSGGGKTTKYIIPSLLSMNVNRSCVVFDPGGDVYAITAGWLIKQGFKVKVIDFDRHDQSEKFDPLFRVSDDLSIQKVADILIDVNYQGKVSDPFWTEGSKSILKILLMALLNKNQKSKPKTLGTLFELLNMFGTEQEELDQFVIRSLPEKAHLVYMAFMESQTEKVQQTILSVAKVALSKVPTLETLISEETLHFESLREEPTVIFVKIREDQIPYFSFVISLFYTQLMDMLMKLPEGDETYLPVTILADEFAAYKVPNVESLITVLRRRKVYLSIILQSLSQLEVYGKHAADTILSNTSSVYIFPAVGDTTASRVEKLLGYYSKDGKKEHVMDSRSIRMMKKDEVLFIHSNLPPVVINMKPWFKVRRFRKRANLPVNKKGGTS